MAKAVTLLSGGLDSTTLAYKLKFDDGYDLITLSFDYGQRHNKRELAAAIGIADHLKAEHHTIALGVRDGERPTAPLSTVLGPSALVNPDAAVPDGHYASENMKQTVVPNRNAIMLSIAYGIAMGAGAEVVAFGAHAGDHTIYPDCRPEFVNALDFAFRTGAAWTADELSYVPQVVSPFVEYSKADVVRLAYMLHVPVEETWSCYKGDDIQCGTCGTCYERREAFELAKVPDPTIYLDNTTRFEEPA